jgi:hypothetical protein
VAEASVYFSVYQNEFKSIQNMTFSKQSTYHDHEVVVEMNTLEDLF